MMKAESVSQSEKFSRVLRVGIKGKELATPTYFPAVSTAEFGSNVFDLMSLVINSSYPRLLISAYDFSGIDRIHKKKLVGEISNYLRTGGFLMVDSGVFESYWKDDDKWSFKSYQSALSKIDSDFYFSYDLLPERFRGSEAQYSKAVISNVRMSAGLNRNELCIPILHGATSKKLLILTKKFIENHPELCNVISIPERECGSSLVERARTISQIREAMNRADLKNCLLHILGCGNPLSMATYAYCGADTFDSVDWNKLLFEPVELRVYDIAQLELLRCNCQICQSMQDKPLPRALLHNLLFYQNFVLQLQQMIRDNTIRDFLLQFLGIENIRAIERKAD